MLRMLALLVLLCTPSDLLAQQAYSVHVECFVFDGDLPDDAMAELQKRLAATPVENRAKRSTDLTISQFKLYRKLLAKAEATLVAGENQTSVQRVESESLLLDLRIAIHGGNSESCKAEINIGACYVDADHNLTAIATHGPHSMALNQPTIPSTASTDGITIILRRVITKPKPNELDNDVSKEFSEEFLRQRPQPQARGNIT